MTDTKDSDFCKLFVDDEGRQILIMIDMDDESLPSVKFYFTPKGLGVCKLGPSWKDDSDKSWDSAEKYFKSITRELAIKISKEALSNLGISND